MMEHLDTHKLLKDGMKLKYRMMIDRMINYWDVLAPLLIDAEEECRKCKLRSCARNCPLLAPSMKLEFRGRFS